MTGAPPRTVPRPLLRRHALAATVIGLLAISPTAFRFDDLGCVAMPVLLACLAVGLGYFAVLVCLAVRQRAWPAMWIGAAGLAVAALPLTQPGFHLAQFCYFWRVHGRYAEQVERASRGQPTSAQVAGATVRVEVNPLRVFFQRRGLLSEIAVVYSPSGNLAPRDRRPPQYAWHLEGAWYWCGWP